MTSELTTVGFKWAAIAAASGAVALLCALLGRVQATVPSTLGLRGRKRAQCLRDIPAFARLEPAICWLGSLWALFTSEHRRLAIERRLREAGHYLGLDAHEFLALSTLAALGGGVAGALAGALAGDIGEIVGGLWTCAALGSFAGYGLVGWHLSEARARRFRDVGRQLPPAIDLVAMCMSAGMDMPGALAVLVRHGDKRDVLLEELTVLLQELELGRTRAAALLNLGERVPTDPVREFVSAVVQAEEKGSPLAEVLKIQAEMLRMRRSVLAEEAASRAGVLMVIPMVMLLGSMMIVLLGAIVLDASETGLFS